MKFKEKNILAADVKVSYVDEGSQAGTPVIFIHGFPFNKTSWNEQLALLRDDFRVLAFDVRGHGHTDSGTQPFSIQQFAEDLFQFMDALQIDKAVLCGLSMGGYIALRAIQDRPDRITGLVLCDTQCAADSEESRKKRSDTARAVQTNGLSQYAEDSVKKLFARASLIDKQEIVSTIKEAILQTSVETITKTLMALADRSETCSSLAKIKVPVLILVGAEDQLTVPEASRKMNELIPHAELGILEQAGHISNLEAPDDFNSRLRAFLISIQAEARVTQ